MSEVLNSEVNGENNPLDNAVVENPESNQPLSNETDANTEVKAEDDESKWEPWIRDRVMRERTKAKKEIAKIRQQAEVELARLNSVQYQNQYIPNNQPSAEASQGVNVTTADLDRLLADRERRQFEERQAYEDSVKKASFRHQFDSSLHEDIDEVKDFFTQPECNYITNYTCELGENDSADFMRHAYKNQRSQIDSLLKLKPAKQIEQWTLLRNQYITDKNRRATSQAPKPATKLTTGSGLGGVSSKLSFDEAKNMSPADLRAYYKRK